MSSNAPAAPAASFAASFEADWARLLPGLQARYATALPELCVPWRATPVPQPRLQVFNAALALELGWPDEALNTPLAAPLWAAHALPPGAQPVAQGYAGHQFGGYSPQLGDGRALLLGEVRDVHGQWRDVAFKGSGRTPFSRGGDGKAALGPMLREYLMSEALHALGVPTTRSLAVASTGETIWRDSGPLPGAVLTRVAASHIRVGTFQWVAARGDTDLLRRLADFTLALHDPHIAQAHPDGQAPSQAAAPVAPPSGPASTANPTGNPYLALLAAVCQRQADLLARWMGLGFIHGVMNTDNMTLSGGTIDYGPCAFMEGFDPGAVFSSIDRDGRYAWGNQPAMAQWNLARLAEALLPLLDADADRAVALATAELDRFADRYTRCWHRVQGAKLGLWPWPWGAARSGHPPATEPVTNPAATPAPGPSTPQADPPHGWPDPTPADAALLADWQALLAGDAGAPGVDWTLAHRLLGDAADPDHPTALARLRALWPDPTALDRWLPRWRQRLAPPAATAQPGGWAAVSQALRRVNPLYIPRNHSVEAALAAASERGDLGPFHQLLAAVQHPFDERPDLAALAQPAPAAWTARHRTFCGT